MAKFIRFNHTDTEYERARKLNSNFAAISSGVIDPQAAPVEVPGSVIAQLQNSITLLNSSVSQINARLDAVQIQLASLIEAIGSWSDPMTIAEAVIDLRSQIANLS